MRTAAVLLYFKTQKATAEALGIAQPSVAGWGEYPPEPKQLLIQAITNGTLQAEPGCYERVIGLDKVVSKEPLVERATDKQGA